MWRTGARFTAQQKGKLAAWLLPPPSPCLYCQQLWHICACPACLVPTTLLPLFSPECTQRPWERRLNTVWHNLHSLLDNLKTWKDSLSLDSRNSFLSCSIGKENTRRLFPFSDFVSNDRVRHSLELSQSCMSVIMLYTVALIRYLIIHKILYFFSCAWDGKQRHRKHKTYENLTPMILHLLVALPPHQPIADLSGPCRLANYSKQENQSLAFDLSSACSLILTLPLFPPTLCLYCTSFHV